MPVESLIEIWSEFIAGETKKLNQENRRDVGIEERVFSQERCSHAAPNDNSLERNSAPPNEVGTHSHPDGYLDRILARQHEECADHLPLASSTVCLDADEGGHACHRHR